MAQHDLETMAHTLERLNAAEQLVLIEQLTRPLREGSLRTSSAHQREALRRLRQELARLPVRYPPDGWSNRDHDQVLCGRSRVRGVSLSHLQIMVTYLVHQWLRF